jgi:hypothetical protein
MTRIEDSIGAAAPPADFTPAQQALSWLRKGGLRLGPEWERAHAICQASEGEAALDGVHALAHWIEGDLGNADYWYRRVGSRRSGEIDAEWRRMAVDLG